MEYFNRAPRIGTLSTAGADGAVDVAVYGSPRLLLLDEPNSNLDGAGEQALAEVLGALRGKVTIVVITHRTTLLQHVDRMLMLDGGRVRHYGPVAEVMQAMRHGGLQVVPGRVGTLPPQSVEGSA